MTMREKIKAVMADWALARYLRRRTKGREARIVRRKADGALFAASSPQNFVYAMDGLFTGKAGFHFAKVRIWRGLPIVSRKIFWRPKSGQFDVLQPLRSFWLAPWPEAVECAMIDAARSGG